jgi:2-phospho-L-lactate/phosphoenolpyruvate guanylyltransferase
MRALLLPIKDLRHAKQRLVGLLTPDERLALAQAMLADTLRAVRGTQKAEKIFVVTNYQPAIQAASELGWEILREEQQISESASVDAASCICAQRGVTALLRLPVDLPLLRSSHIDELLAIECAAPEMVIVPSRDGTGTNALLRTPPTLFPSHFGEGSFAKHCEEAHRAGARVIIRRNEWLEMDVDEGNDLRALVRFDLAGTNTGAWLEQARVRDRLKTWPAANRYAANG